MVSLQVGSVGLVGSGPPVPFHSPMKSFRGARPALAAATPDLSAATLTVTATISASSAPRPSSRFMKGVLVSAVRGGLTRLDDASLKKVPRGQAVRNSPRIFDTRTACAD